MVGTVMAMDLCSDDAFAHVTIVDASAEALDRASARTGRGVRTVRADLSDPDTVGSVVCDSDIVLGALPSTIGYQALRAVIEAGKHYCDISFMREDGTDLDGLARDRGVTAVIDCGVAPGLSNMLAGYASTQLDEIDRVAIYVGGLPVERRWPYQYKAPFSPYDVIEEYTRPSRIVEHGSVVTRPALSDRELIDFAGIGTLEAFVTDGLRSLVSTIKAQHMVEKTLRYPGHCQLMAVLRHIGLFNHQPILVGPDRLEIRPIDVTSALMFPQWEYDDHEPDLTVMRVIVEGARKGRMERVRYQWDLLDRYDTETNTSSLARTTALPNTIMARLVADGQFREPGVHPPERVGRVPGLLDRVLEQLAQRGVHLVGSVGPCATAMADESR